MTNPTSLSGNSTTSNSQRIIIPIPLYQESSLEVQTDQISQPIFTIHNADRQASDRLRTNNEQETNTSKDQPSRKRARNDDKIQGAFKKIRREEKEGVNQNPSIQKITLSNGTVFEGEYKDGKAHGHGKETYPDGRVFEGEYKDGKAHGHGKETYPDGTVFEGAYKDGKAHGPGKATYPDGRVFEGEYKDGNAHGPGKETYPDGTVFEGEFKDGKRNGHGKETCC